jgi:hypothetical protein
MNGYVFRSMVRWWPCYLKDFLAGLPTLFATEMYLVLHVRCADAISYPLPLVVCCKYEDNPNATLVREVVGSKVVLK